MVGMSCRAARVDAQRFKEVADGLCRCGREFHRSRECARRRARRVGRDHPEREPGERRPPYASAEPGSFRAEWERIAPMIADAGLLPSEARKMTPRDLTTWLDAAVRRRIREQDERAWIVAHLLVGMHAFPRWVTLGHAMKLLLGREPGQLPGKEPPDMGLTGDQADAWMRAFVAEQTARVARIASA